MPSLRQKQALARRRVLGNRRAQRTFIANISGQFENANVETPDGRRVTATTVGSQQMRHDVLVVETGDIYWAIL